MTAMSRVFLLLFVRFILSIGFTLQPTGVLFERRRNLPHRPPQLALSETSNVADTVTPPGSPLATMVETERRVNLLSDALLSFNSSSAAKLIDELVEIRRNDSDTIDVVLNELLAHGPDRDLSLWSGLRLLSPFSRRARMASLSRTLDITTPPPNDETDGDELEDKQRRRRRALLSLLRVLASDSEQSSGPLRVAIVALEKKARREKNFATRGEDLTARRPEGLETPKYNVLFKIPAERFEIRRYDQFSVASVSMYKPRPDDATRTDAQVQDPQTSGASAFGALAGYLFGKNQNKEAMAMTTPVLIRGEGLDREMAFVMPSKFWKDGDIITAPEPLKGSGVSLQVKSGGERAVIMFGGYASKKEVDKRKKQLVRLLSRNNDWEAVEGDMITLSQYNDPFTPPWKRLNEVSVAVRPRS